MINQKRKTIGEYQLKHDYAYRSEKIVVFKKPSSDDITYIVYALPAEGIVIFDWVARTSTQVAVATLPFLIKKMIAGYEIDSVLKTRSGKAFINDKLFKKYRLLLRKHYGKFIYLDEAFQQFLLSAFYDDESMLKSAMKKINYHINLDVGK